MNRIAEVRRTFLKKSAIAALALLTPLILETLTKETLTILI